MHLAPIGAADVANADNANQNVPVLTADTIMEASTGVERVQSMAFDGGDRLIVGGQSDGCVFVCDLLQSKGVRTVWRADDEQVFAVSFVAHDSADIVCTGAASGRIRVCVP